MKEQLLRVRQAADLLSIDQATLRSWVRQGLLPEIRTKGLHRRFRLDDVLALQRKRKASLATGRRLAETAFRLSAKAGGR